ncbi:MAG: hypothetical protein IKP66_00510 [Lachnospiraceae bacterium]|nr:hypothetical protein [Lachnospiraceae bacterium]
MYKNYEEKNSIVLLCNEIRKALNNKMYFAALIMSLAVPDVLGKLEYNSDNMYYAKWYDEYVRDCMGLTYNERKQHFHRDSKDPNIFDGIQCYNLRCSLFHNAGMDLEKKTRIKEFVIQLSEEPFVRGTYANIDYDYDNLKVGENGEILEESKIYQLYISANEIATGLVDAAELYMKNNIEKIEKLDKIKINQKGGITPKNLNMRLRDE